MDELLQTMAVELSKQITERVLSAVESRLAAQGKAEAKYFFTVREAAVKLGCSQQTVERLRKCGELDYTRNGRGTIVYLEKHITAYLARHETKANGNVVKFPKAA